MRERHIGLGHQRIEIIEIGNPRQPRHHDPNATRSPTREPRQVENILGGEAVGGVEPGDDAQIGHPGPCLDDPMGIIEQSRITPELVDQIAFQTLALAWLQQQVGAHEGRDHPATLDVADQHHRQIGGLGKAHVGDVARPQIDLGRTPRPLDQHQIRLTPQPFITFNDLRHQTRTQLEIVARGIVAQRRAPEPPPERRSRSAA